jgi:hypothetical protein
LEPDLEALGVRVLGDDLGEGGREALFLKRSCAAGSVSA